MAPTVLSLQDKIDRIIFRSVNTRKAAYKLERQVWSQSIAGWNTEMKSKERHELVIVETGWWMETEKQRTGASPTGISADGKTVLLVSTQCALCIGGCKCYIVANVNIVLPARKMLLIRCLHKQH